MGQPRAAQQPPAYDPAVRQVAVFLPSQAGQGTRLPVVYYLPGYGGSPEGFISHSNFWINFTQRLARKVTPMTLVVVDGRTRWGGSQYLNSPRRDQYLAQIGAHAIFEAIRKRVRRCTFYEPPGRHGQHLPARLERGLEWIFDRPVQNIK